MKKRKTWVSMSNKEKVLFILKKIVSVYFAIEEYLIIAVIGLMFGFAIMLPQLLEVKYGTDYYIYVFGKLHRGDVLGYVGSLIGAFATFLGIILTLNHNRRMVKKQLKKSDEKFELERILSVLPIITINKIMYEFDDISKLISEKKKQNIFSIFNKQKQEVIEEDLKEHSFDETVISFEKDITTMYPHLFDEQKKTIKLGALVVEGNTHTILSNVPYLYSPFYLVNSGKGTVVNLQISIYKEDNEKDDNLIISSQYINLAPGQKFKLSFYADKVEYLGDIKYILQLEYQNIYKNTYIQEHPFWFNHDEKYFFLTCEINAEQIN